MKLYFTPGACSLSPHIVLREAQLPFELSKVDLAARKTESGANFNDVNPKGQVPTLELDDGSVLTEVPAIVQYLADRKPGSNLAPAAGTTERYRLQEWLNFITSELHKGLSPLFNSEMPQAAKQLIKQAIVSKFDYLDHHLANHQYLLNGRFSVADSYAFTIVSWSKLFDIDLTPWPNLQEYMQRIAQRPSVRDALKAEGLTG